MREKFSIRTTLLSSFWILLTLALLIPSWFYYRSITGAVTEEATSAAVKELKLVQWLLEQEGSFHDEEEVQLWLSELGRQKGMRITYLAEDGRVLFDSDASLAQISEIENFSTRPEVIQAQSAGLGLTIRHSRTIQKEFIFAAKQVTGSGKLPAGFLRIAIPFSNVKEVLNRIKRTFVIVVAIIFAATALLSHGLVRRLRSPLNTLTDAIRAIGGHDYKRRVRFSPDQEYYPIAKSINQMAESIERQFLGISEEKQRMEAVFDGMREGVMVLDSQGRILSINRALSEMVEKPSQYEGMRPIELIMSLELQESCDTMFRTAGRNAYVPDKLQIELGEGRTYDVTLVRPEDKQEGMGAILVFHDISELKRLERARRDFLANVSHELRTPLTSIKRYTEALLNSKEPDPSTLSSFLQSILCNCNHTEKMVDDLLYLARLEGRETPGIETTSNPSLALTAAWTTCAALGESKAIGLLSELPKEGIDVAVDFDQLVHVFRNLLENSITHSPDGSSLTVTYRIENEAIEFSIRDEGPGIPRQFQQRIFERFFRIEKQRGNELGSTGLGLAICRHITKNHGGKIWVESPNPGGLTGSTFYFTLPRASSENTAEEGAM